MTIFLALAGPQSKHQLNEGSLSTPSTSVMDSEAG